MSTAAPSRGWDGGEGRGARETIAIQNVSDTAIQNVSDTAHPNAQVRGTDKMCPWPNHGAADENTKRDERDPVAVDRGTKDFAGGLFSESLGLSQPGVRFTPSGPNGTAFVRINTPRGPVEFRPADVREERKLAQQEISSPCPDSFF